MKTNEGWDDMLKAAKAKSGPQPNGGAGVKQGTRYGGSKSKMDAPAPTKGPSVAQLRSLKKDMKKEEVEHIDESDSQQKYKDRAKEAKKAGDHVGYHANMHDYYQGHADARTSGGAGNTIKNMQKARFHKQELQYYRAKAKNATNEEVEQVDEISKATKLSYYTKATTGKRRPQDYEKQSKADAQRMKDEPENPAWKKRKDHWDNKADKRRQGIDRAKAALTKEEVEQVNEDMKSAAAELSKYAKEYGGIDKADFQTAAKHMSAGNHKALHNHIKKLDTDPRDKILTTLHKHGNDIKRYGYATEAVEKCCDKCDKPLNKCECEMDEALVGNQHKLDKNKNGRLDKDDFKKIRGEEKDVVTMNPKMKSSKTSGSMNSESVKSADKKAEMYTDSKGKTKYRMVSKDKDMKVESKIRTSLKSVLENKQTAGALKQSMNDSNTLSGEGAKKMKKDHEPVMPEAGDESAVDKKNFKTMADSGKKSPMRPNDNPQGDKKIINPVEDITKKASAKEDDGFKEGGAPKLATSESFIDKISQIYKNMFK